MMHELSVLSTLAATTLAADFPQTEISNGSVRAKLYLPDARQGYYRATRFDWSGQIASLEVQGHNYFGQWFDRYDPKLHDSILDPVEEFLANGLGLGYMAKDYDIRVENAAAHAGVRQTSNRTLAKPVFWSIRTTVCPEAYIDMRIEPGKEFTWRIAYDFYTLPESGAK
jgi:hypothetical protein